MYTIEKAFCICVCAAWPHHHLYKSETFGSVSGLVITTPPEQFSVKLSRQTINNEHLTLSQWKSWISLIKIESKSHWIENKICYGFNYQNIEPGDLC